MTKKVKPEDDPEWLKTAAKGSDFDPEGNTEPDPSTCIVTGFGCPDSNCGKC